MKVNAVHLTLRVSLFKMPITDQGLSQAKRYASLYQYNERVRKSTKSSPIRNADELVFTSPVDPRYFIPGLSDTS